MKVGMIQSSYLPWQGYFDFIDDVDTFVFYDDVQYTRRDWRNRNRFYSTSGSYWLTVPVHFSQTHKQEIRHTQIDYSQNWQHKHIGSLKHNYQKAPYFENYAYDLFSILETNHDSISSLNIRLIKFLADVLQINTTYMYSWEFGIGGNRNTRIIEILKHLGATEYLVGPTASAYIDKDLYAAAGIKLNYKAYDYSEYAQPSKKFQSNLSVIDLLFNCGENSRRYLKSTSENKVVI